MSTDELRAYQARRILKQMPKLPSLEQLTAESQAEDEAELQKQIVQYLNLHSIPNFRQRMDKKTRGVVGWPDHSYVVNGKACFIECKVGRNVLSKEQIDVKDALILAGARYHLCYSLEEAIAAIKEDQQ